MPVTLYPATSRGAGETYPDQWGVPAEMTAKQAT